MAGSWSLRQIPSSLASWSDDQLLTTCGWERTAPAALVAAARTGLPAKFGPEWRRELKRRRTLATTSLKELQSLWSPCEGVDSPVMRAFETLSSRGTQRAARRPAIKANTSWLVRIQPLIKALIADDTDPAQGTLAELLVSLELLWTVGDRLPQRFWWPLWRRTLMRLAAFPETAVSPSDPADVQLLVTGELRVLAGLVFFHQSGAGESIRKGARVLRRALVAQTDTDGTPHSELLPRLPYWLAPLVRATGWCRATEQSLWSEDERELLSNLLEKGVALCRPGGQLALTNGLVANALPILNAGAEILDWPATNPARASLRSLSQFAAGNVPKTPASGVMTLMPSNQSDWARFALLRTDWTAGAASLAIAHHQPIPQLDVTVLGEAIMHGDWGLDVVVGDARIELAPEWSCVCWESQPEADYAELQMTGPGRLRVERMLLLSREDQFLMIADTISGAGAAEIALRSRLTLGPGVSLQREETTRSLSIAARRARLRAYPLLLPSDPVESTPHLMSVDEGSLTLTYRAAGAGLCAPLILDFHPQRRRRDVLWRKLTVTEGGQVVGNDAAAAFRWRVGKEQWLVYRSLKAPKVPRAVLGYHTGTGFALGRFDTSGDVDPLIMVES